MWSRFFPPFRRPDPEPEPAGPQYGAVPFTLVEGRLVVLLVTSRGRGRWIFPKGGLIAGMTPTQSAAHEALEEAGVLGEIDEDPIGSYFLPITPERPAPIEVKMFPLRVTSQNQEWKEKGQRYRHWAVVPEATRLVTHEGLADLVLALDKRQSRPF